MKAHSATSAAALVVATLVAGCAPDGTLTSNGLNTSSINQEGAMAKTDPACVTLASQIDALNQEGIANKVSKAAAKKYKMKSADLAKADALNKAHTEFQTKCSSYPPSPVVTAAEPATAATTVAAKTKAKPPMPSPKPVAAAMAPESATPAPTAATAATPEALGQQPPAQP
jgi:hypothetical protein